MNKENNPPVDQTVASREQGVNLSPSEIEAIAQWQSGSKQIKAKGGREIGAAVPQAVMKIMEKFPNGLPKDVAEQVAEREQVLNEYANQLDGYVERNFAALDLRLKAEESMQNRSALPPGMDTSIMLDKNLGEALKNPEIVARIKEAREVKDEQVKREQTERTRAMGILDGLDQAGAFAAGDPTFRKALLVKAEKLMEQLKKQG